MFFCATIFAIDVSAEHLYGVDFPETSSINNDENIPVHLQLNGFGLRSYGLLRTKIYVAALYLEFPSSESLEILNSEQAKQIKMQYLRNIDKKDMRDAWVYYFEENCPARDCSAHQQEIDQFSKTVIAAKPNDRYDYRFFSDHTEILINDKHLADIKGEAFARLLLSTWIGDRPPTKKLKQNLLNLH